LKLIQFGAGNIGRSFIAQIFSRAGWEVVFVDINHSLIDELNRRREYRVEIKDRSCYSLIVKNVRGVFADALESVSREISEADILATAVGQKALPEIMHTIAEGLKKRLKTFPVKPLDIIICENMQNGAQFFREHLIRELGEDLPFSEMVGLVETSIGKMVPIMSEEEKKRDSLLVYAEAFNTLILDKKGFKGPIPQIPELDPKDNIKAYVDRKLYIHNLGHAVTAYISYVFRPEYAFIWQAVEDREIKSITEGAMWEAGRSLIEEYPDEFSKENMEKHIQELLLRFANRALRDTIYRVGRDLYRKLAPDDRLIGGIKLARKHGILPRNIALGVACAMFFNATDEKGEMYENDRLFHEREVTEGIEHVLKYISKLEDKEIITLIKSYHNAILNKERDFNKILKL